MPDLKWLEDALPQGEKWSSFNKKLLEVGGLVKNAIEIGKYLTKNYVLFVELILDGLFNARTYFILFSTNLKIYFFIFIFNL